MKNPLSFSAYKKYITCPKMYEYHYIKKDRPGKQSSALLFGTIMDEVINDILLKKTKDPHGDVNLAIDNVLHEDIEFYDGDFDKDLVDMAFYEESAKKLGWKGKDLASAIKDFVKNQDTISEKQKELLRAICWDSLQFKAGCMIDGFIKWVQPMIKEVHDVQKHLVSEDGTMHGYLDFTCTLNDGRKVLFDVKTSKMPYAKDAVCKSPQLALYSAIEDYEYAGFIVLTKTLNKNKVKTCKACSVEITGGNTKNCPKCKKPMHIVSDPTSFVQVLIDKVSNWNKDLTIGAMSDTIECIDRGIFPRNLDKCFYMYGKPCVYAGKCWKRGN